MTTSPSRKTGPRPDSAFYRCSNFRLAPYEKFCSSSQVYQEVIEEPAWRELWALLTDPDRLWRLGEAYCASIQKPQTDDLTKLQHERAEIQARIKRTQKMMQDADIEYNQGHSDIQADKGRIRLIDEQLYSAGQDVVSMPPRHQLEAFVREIAADEPGSAAETAEQRYSERRPVLAKIRDLRMTYFDGRLEICGKIPVPATCAKETVEKNWSDLFPLRSNEMLVFPVFRISSIHTKNNYFSTQIFDDWEHREHWEQR